MQNAYYEIIDMKFLKELQIENINLSNLRLNYGNIYNSIDKMYIVKEYSPNILLLSVNVGTDFWINFGRTMGIPLDKFFIKRRNLNYDLSYTDLSPYLRIGIKMGSEINPILYRQKIGMLQYDPVNNLDPINPTATLSFIPPNRAIGSCEENPYIDEYNYPSISDLPIKFSSWFELAGFIPFFDTREIEDFYNRFYNRNTAYIKIENPQFPLYFGAQVNYTSCGLGWKHHYSIHGNFPKKKPMNIFNFFEYDAFISAFGKEVNLNEYPDQQFGCFIRTYTSSGELPQTYGDYLDQFSRPGIPSPYVPISPIYELDDSSQRLKLKETFIYFVKILNENRLYYLTDMEGNYKNNNGDWDSEVIKTNQLTWTHDSQQTHIDDQTYFLTLGKIDKDPITNELVHTQMNYEPFIIP